MKKIIRFILVILLLISGLGITSYNASASETEVELILHKYIARDLVANEIDEYPNDGLPISEEDWQDVDVVTKATPLNGANFRVYDITDYYYASNDQGQPFVDRLSKMKRKEIENLVTSENFEEVADSPVNTVNDTEFGRGTGRITLDRKRGQLDCVYLIVETAVDHDIGFNVDIESKAIPIAVVLPITDPRDNTTVLDQIHIYPKNVGYVRDPYFFKLGKTEGSEELTPLQGVPFALYQLIDGQKHYLRQSAVIDLKNEWVVSEDPLNDPNVTKFVSDADGVVTTNERYLPSGTYYFEELEAAEGYSFTAAEQQIEVVIPESWEDENGDHLYVTVNGYPMEELASGRVPESAYDRQEPRVYNFKEKSPPPTTPGGRLPTTGEAKTLTSPKRSGTLPTTGEAKTFAFLLGVLIVTVAWYLRKKVKVARSAK